ncbi:hypothetical protein H6G06_21950 [Anabaena sphaerica FACHB-251]|uniref:Uncharacterized protein n=1 Tax=Anabaena sphaerica FACHB-251 TaxID=2692883 RepID=A0A926WME4_9NOST|nr:hypothetical protein [Anabaena sphaerica]MBD2296066.1 hypothetical protein [Anabaena sphaerica FACHB-251]
MFTNKTAILSITELVEELTDTSSEQLCGGTIITPEGAARNAGKTLPSAGKTGTDANIPSSAEVGLTPFYPPLPNMKLARLGSLKRNNGVANKKTTTLSSPA